jgi:DNA-binding transcriptional LysR family regulator
MDRSDVTFERMRTFVRVAERGSLSAVARELGLGQSTVTRHLRELEEAVGVPLLSRTTRRVTMTDEGSRYYANSVQILRLVEQAGDEARGTRGASAGTIRISCTAAFGVLHASRLIFAFQDRHPDIAVDLSLTDERVDLVGEGVDIALRLGPLTDSSIWQREGRLLSRRTCPAMRVSGCRTLRGATSSLCRGRAATAMRCPSQDVFGSTMDLPRARLLSPGAASHPPITGLSTISWRPAGSSRSCLTIRCHPSR